MAINMEFNDFSDLKNRFSNNAKGAGHTRATIIIIAAVALCIAVFVYFGKPLLEYWQIKEIGENFTRVFWTNLWAKTITVLVGFVIFLAVLLINVFAFRRLAVLKYLNFSFLKKKWPYILICIIFALLAGRVAGNDLYLRLLMALKGESFKTVDALFSRDIGYYIFTRPFLTAIVSGIKAFLIAQIVLLALFYYLIFAKNGYKNLKEIILTQRGAFVHIVINVICYFVLVMLSYRFSAEGLLYSSFGSSGSITGAGFVQANILAVYYKVAPFLILLAIVFVLVFLYRKKYIATIAALLAVPVVSLIVNVAGYVTDSLFVNPNERNIQSPYIKNNIDATISAFNLKRLNDVEYDIKNNITMQDVIEHKNELDNIRITDFGASLTAYNQLQYFRKYYTFNDIDVVPYKVDGQIKAFFLAAREMNKNIADEAAQSYANKMFRYTHGFGVVASPINRVTPEGQPEFIVKDIPPVSGGGLPKITQPRIYYGELSNDYVIVGGGNKELDYSEGLTDVEFSYDGTAGIEMTPFKRLMFAIYYGDYRMVFSSNINKDSKMLLNRNILKRAEKVAPFFTYDSDPYIVIADDGSLKWIIDGYSTSNYYPYAQSYNGINYIRNSVKVITDAYTGDMKYYVIDEEDPIVKTYRNIYPDLFSGEPIPDGIINHITVPEYMFKIQRNVYQMYHVSEPGQFYDKADVWSVATEKYNNSDVEVEPYFNVMEIEPQGELELVLTTPFVLYGKYNMVGFLIMRTVPEHYGELVLYRIPKNMTVYGSMQIENRIDNDPEISREMTLWNSGGSTVIRGNLLVVPFRDSLIYVEPIYISTHNSSSLPELKRIIVAYKDNIAMEDTLDESLAKVLGAKVSDTEIMQPAPLPKNTDVSEAADAIQKVIASYEKFRNASGDNDFAKAGESLAELDKNMAELEKSAK